MAPVVMENIGKDLFYPSCLDYLTKPMGLQYGHIFCHDCIVTVRSSVSFPWKIVLYSLQVAISEVQLLATLADGWLGASRGMNQENAPLCSIREILIVQRDPSRALCEGPHSIKSMRKSS